MTLDFKKFLLAILIISILFLSLESVFAVSDNENFTNSSLETSISDSNFVVDCNENVDGEFIWR